LTVKALEANPDAALCGTGVSIVDEDGIEYDPWTPPGGPTTTGAASKAAPFAVDARPLPA
jgi:hypothetical protein